MTDGALEANAATLTLLSLSQQEASGEVSFAGRMVRLSDGDVVSIGAGEADEPLWEFIRRSERLSPEQLERLLERADQARKAGDSEDVEREQRFRDVLAGWEQAEQHRIGPLVRAFYLERLVRCLRVPGARPSHLRVAPPAKGRRNETRIKTLPLVLDALARVALEEDAAIVGGELRARLQWIPGPLAADARHWAALGDVTEESTLAAILAKRPASVPAIAALVRAGLARLMSPPPVARGLSPRTDTLPPPAPRLNALPDEEAEPEQGLVLTEQPRLRLAPGLAVVNVEPFAPVAPPALRARDPELVDALRALELEIEELERTEGNGLSLSARWEALADLWEHRLDCSSEAMRALREAAAAYPFSTRLLQRTALACAMTGHHSLAMEYATAGVAVAGDPHEQSSAELFAAQLELRRFDVPAALEHLQRAADLNDGDVDAELLERAAALKHIEFTSRSETADAFAVAARALSGHRGRACALWSMAYVLDRSKQQNAMGFAASLTSTDHAHAGIAVLLDYAGRVQVRDERVALLVDAARRAEFAGQGLLALQALLLAFAHHPHASLSHDPLSQHLDSDGLEPAERAAISLDIANHCSAGKRSHFLFKAGAATLACPGEAELGRLLLKMALAEGAPRQDVAALLGPVESTTPPDPKELAAGLRKRAEEAESADEQAQLYRRLAGLEHAAHNVRGTISAALRCLTLSPRDPVAAARLLRAATLLGDASILREALHYSARATGDERRRAMHLSALATLFEDGGEIEEALRCAESALQDDRLSCAAALVVIRCHSHLPPVRAHDLLTRALNPFPDLPPLLSLRAQAAHKAKDMAAARDALARWAVASPFDPEPRALRLQYDLASSDQPPLLLSATALLEVMLRHEHMTLISKACSRAAEQGDLSGAATLLLQLIHHTGSRDPMLAERALEYARLAADAQLVASTLEQLAHCQEGRERARTLRLLAEQHRRRGDGVAELRTRMRVLAESGYDLESVDRLGDLFAAAGDGKRLGALLTLALQAVRTPPERKTLWIRMACARAQLSRDQPGMLRHIGALLKEQGRDPTVVRVAVGIALHLAESMTSGIDGLFELCTTLPDETGAAVALGLVKTAQEVLGDQDLALRLCSTTAPRFPLCGELLLLLESLALAAGEVDTALAAYDALITRAAGRQGQRALNYRAGRFLERVADDQAALDRYLRALSLSPAPGTILVSIERVSEKLHRYTALLEAYCLVARYASDDSTRNRFAAWAYALARRHAKTQALSIATEFNVMPEQRESLRITASFESPNKPHIESASLRPAAWERLPEKPGDTRPGLSEGGPQLSEAAVREAAASGSPEAQSALAQLLVQKNQLEEAHALFHGLVRNEPERTDALRGLWRTARPLGTVAIEHVCAQWLSLADESVPAVSPRQFKAEHWAEEDLQRLLNGDLPDDVSRVLHIVWQSARSVPDLLLPMASYGVDSRHLAMAHSSPRITRATRTLSTQLRIPRAPVYYRPQGEVLSVTATHPCAVLAPTSLEDAPDLEGQLAYALIKTTPAHALVLAPDPTLVDGLVGGLLAAYGPEQAVAAASLQDKVTAAALWDAVPARDQDFVRRTLKEHLSFFQGEALRQRAELASLRAALLVTGNPSVALRLMRLPPRFRGDGDFSRLCVANPLLAELVRTTLSESYLAALARNL